MNRSLSSCAFALLFLTSGVAAFFQSKPAAAKAAVSTDEAVGIFAQKYPFGRAPPKNNPFLQFGMPGGDSKKTYTESKRLTDITEQQAEATFNELAKLYGNDSALDMVKALPLVLAFDKQYFAASLKEWTEIFGEEESKGMVDRNPGLLAIRPTEAARADDQTMAFSYVVSFTRPLGPVALPLLLVLLLTPAIETVTGIPIRSSFLGL